eukprot:scaffold17875_cov112-Isochrysis_galbana.AAC.1
MGECNVIRKLFMRINSLKALEDPFVFPLTPVWEYELYGGAQLAPHHLYVLARLLTPPEGVWEGPRAIVRLPRNPGWAVT